MPLLRSHGTLSRVQRYTFTHHHRADGQSGRSATATSLFAEIRSLLSNLWAETGSGLEPNGAGASSASGAEPNAATTGDNGSRLDPDGRR